MKVVILAGGMGTRLGKETENKPKPMVEIGGMPIIEHIMARYSMFGYDDFVIAAGYKKEEFYKLRGVTVFDTGEKTNTGGRVKQCVEFIKEPFMMTYGDGLANVDLDALLGHHVKSKSILTFTAVHPPARFGEVVFRDNKIVSFSEKSGQDKAWISGGFFVVEPSVVDYIENDGTSFEHTTIPALLRGNNLSVYKHNGFWQCMDTIHDLNKLNELSGDAPWLKW